MAYQSMILTLEDGAKKVKSEGQFAPFQSGSSWACLHVPHRGHCLHNWQPCAHVVTSTHMLFLPICPLQVVFRFGGQVHEVHLSSWSDYTRDPKMAPAVAMEAVILLQCFTCERHWV